MYKEKILPAYFHATCGGRTQNASRVWNTNLPPLKGRKCGYCRKSPHFNWTRKIPLASIQKKLNKNGYKIKDIRNIKTSSRDASGRLKTVNIIDSLGTEKIPANKFRLAIGPNAIRSTDFKVRVKGDVAIFKGQGWGHGVGMCQWGAYYMAKHRFKAENILKFYYPGSRIMDLKDIIRED